MLKYFKKNIIILLLGISIFLSSCNYIPVKRSTLDKKEKEIATLKTEKQSIESKYNTEITKKKIEVLSSKQSRVSVGGAQAIAVLGTLKAEPNKTKYTEAGIKGLEVTKNALKDQVTSGDLLIALETQNNLISDQAKQILDGNKTIDRLNKEIDDKKQIEEKLNIKISDIEKEKNTVLIEKNEAITKKEDILKEKSDLLNAINDSKAKQFDEDNSFFTKFNPFTHLSKFFSSIFIWIFIFVILGGLLKICSIIFPGVNVLQIIVKGIGSVVGGVLKLLFGAIPGLFSGLGAVKKEEFEKEKLIANNSVGALQEIKYENPELYQKTIKPKLQEWNQDDKEINDLIEVKLKELNLK